MWPTRVSNFDRARARWGRLADVFAAAHLRMDPLGDALAAAFAERPRAEGAHLLERAITAGVDHVDDPPEALVAFFRHLDHVPAWVDWDQIDLGARTYQRVGMAGGLTLSAVSLMNGYHSSGAVKPLLFTGRLTQMARRRLAETGRFIVETIQVGGLRRFAPGFAITARVRHIHAVVRRALLASPEWKTEAWGAPVNQADLAATNLAFSIELIRGVSTMGMRLRPRESDALIHLWRYSGYLSGVEEGLLPIDTADAWSRAELVDTLQPGPDEGSRALAEALRAVRRVRRPGLLDPVLGPVLTRYHDGLTRAVIGDAKADGLGAPHGAWRHVVRGLAPVIGLAERARERLPLGTRVATFLGNRGWRNAVEIELQGRDADFAAPALGPEAPGREGASRGERAARRGSESSATR